MAQYKVVPMADDAGFFKVEGLTQKLLKNLAVTFGCDIQPTDTDQDKIDKMTSALYDVRHENTHAVNDGDVFETPYGNLVVRGNLVVADDQNGQQAAAAQQGQNVATQGMTLGQVCQANGITIPANFPKNLVNTPIDQIPWGTVAVPPHLKPLFAPPAALPQTAPAVSASGFPTGPLGPMPVGVGKSAVSAPAGTLPAQIQAAVQSLSQLSIGAPVAVSAQAVDQNGGVFSAQLQLNQGFTNQEVIEEFDTIIQHAFGEGNLRSVIAYPHNPNKRVLEVGYHSDTFRVVIEIQ